MEEVGADQISFSLSSEEALPAKATRVLKRTTGLIKRWQPRYLELADRKLTYRRNLNVDADLRTIDFELLTVKVTVTADTLVVAPLKSKRSFIFKFDTKEEAGEWRKTIMTHIQNSRGSLRELPHFVRIRNYWRHAYISEHNFLKLASTGDILLFKGSARLAKMQRVFTRSKYDHVALLMRYASGDLAFFEAIQHEGVTIVSWDDFKMNNWQTLYSVMSFRQLAAHRSDDLLIRLQEFIDRVKGRRYKVSMSKLCGLGRRRNPTNEQDYFCSELVAVCLQIMGFLPEGETPGRYLPGDFSAKKVLPLINGARLGPELRIDFQIE
mmetsp:Transcript_6991/g.12842  ORF Transcript_6991/g.12842 Transcript_6991/m.12842 type:complete len:324 (-) Transcript_6991:783-1754(-)